MNRGRLQVVQDIDKREVFKAAAQDVTQLSPAPVTGALRSLKNMFLSAGSETAAEMFEAAKYVERPASVFNVSGSAGAQNYRELGLKSGSVVGVSDSGASAVARIYAQHDQEAARRKASNDTTMFLYMLQSLEAQIKALEEQVDRYDEQIEATDSLIDILERGDQIDPTDPEHQRLLKLAGIPEEEWGTVTLDDLKKRRQDLQEKRDKAQDDLDRKVELNERLSVIESKMDAMQPVTLEDMGMYEAFETYQGLNPDVNANQLSAYDITEITKIHNLEIYLNERDISIAADVDWFKAAYAELQLQESDPADPMHSYYVDQMLEKMSEASYDELLKEFASDTYILETIAIEKLNIMLKDTDINDPMALEFSAFEINNSFDENTKKILVNSDAVPEQVKEILRQGLPDEAVRNQSHDLSQ